MESHLFGLQAQRQIDAANVEIACRWDDAPPFVVRIHLVTPGPDVRVEGAGQTAQAAVRKAMQALDTDVRRRAAKNVRRRKSNLQSPRNCSNGLRGRH